jgi:dienelactone hydrolase
MHVIRQDPHWDPAASLAPERQTDGEHQLIWFSGAGGARVPAFLIEPDRLPRAAVVFQHAATGEADWALAEARALAADGFASLSIVAPFARPDPHRIVADWNDPASIRAGYMQSILDVRAGIEFLVRELSVGSRRIGYVGKNLGGALAGGVVARDERIAAAVTVASLPRMSWFWANADHPAATRRRARHGQANMSRAADLTAEFDLRAARRASCDWLLQYGKKDEWTPAATVEREIAALPRAVVRWYDDGHDLTLSKAAADRRNFLLARFI